MRCLMSFSIDGMLEPQPDAECTKPFSQVAFLMPLQAKGMEMGLFGVERAI